MESTKTMLESAVIGPWIYKTCQTQLLNVPKSLKPGVFYKVINQVSRDADESVDRIVNDLSFIYLVGHLKKSPFTKL
jgi:hypothetical protein